MYPAVGEAGTKGAGAVFPQGMPSYRVWAGEMRTGQGAPQRHGRQDSARPGEEAVRTEITGSS